MWCGVVSDKEVDKLAAKNNYTVSAILRKIVIVLNLDSEGSEFNMSYPLFKRVLMTFENVSPIITYERTAKDKYRLLQEFQFISETGVLNLTKVREYLADLEKGAM